jgi:putative endonuclease
MYYVYILVCLRSGHSYVGQTDHLIRRFRMHCEGGTRTTREKLIEPVVVYWESFSTRPEAVRRERYFKNGAGHRLKRSLIESALPLFRSAATRAGIERLSVERATS